MIKQYPAEKKWTLLLLILSFCSFSCENRNPDAVAQAKKLYGKKIKFPKEYLSVATNEGTTSINTELAKPLKIVTYLDKNSCSECALKILKHWEELLQELSDYSIGFVPVVYPNDITDLKETLQVLQIDFPLFYDKENKFLKINKLEKTLARNRSFLLSADNKIIVIGEPLASGELWQVYKNSMKRLNE